MEAIAKQKRAYLSLELLAIVFGVLYTILYIREDKTCFYYAFVGSSIYAYLCYKKGILAESFLQVFYVLFAIYGYLNWGGEFKNATYSTGVNFSIFGASVFGVVGVGYFLKNKTTAKLPYLDAYTTVLALTGTWLMVNFIHINWLYFIAVNAVSIVLYYQRGMKLSVLLYAFYLYLSVIGYFQLELPF